MAHRVAILLCAGYGTRMGALTQHTPKPLLRVADRPVLDYLIDQLLELPELQAVHVVSNDRYAADFEAWADGHRDGLGRRGLDLQVHNDGTLDNSDRLGAIGDLGFVLNRLATDSRPLDGALICAGDNILRFSLLPLWLRFLERGETTVLAMEEHDPARLRRTGVLELDAHDRVLRLWEKPEQPPSTWACPSFYTLGPKALARVGRYLEDGHAPDEIGRLIGYLAELPTEFQRVWAIRTRGERLHVGNADALRHADELLRREEVLIPESAPAR